MTILRKAAVLVAALVLVALAAPSAFAQFDQGLNPEIEIPGDRGVVYDGPPIPNALLARYIVFPTNEQKRRRNLVPPVDPPESGGEDVVHSAGPSQQSTFSGNERQATVRRASQSLLTPQRGVVRPRIRSVIEALENELRGAQDELGLR